MVTVSGFSYAGDSRVPFLFLRCAALGGSPLTPPPSLAGKDLGTRLSPAAFAALQYLPRRLSYTQPLGSGAARGPGALQPGTFLSWGPAAQAHGTAIGRGTCHLGIAGTSATVVPCWPRLSPCLLSLTASQALVTRSLAASCPDTWPLDVQVGRRKFQKAASAPGPAPELVEQGWLAFAAGACQTPMGVRR